MLLLSIQRPSGVDEGEATPGPDLARVHSGRSGPTEHEDGGLKGLLQNGIVIVIRYERQQESKVPWHMRFTPSWQFTLEDRLRADHQRRRQQQALRLMTVRTDGPGSDVYMGKRLELKDV